MWAANGCTAFIIRVNILSSKVLDIVLFYKVRAWLKPGLPAIVRIFLFIREGLSEISFETLNFSEDCSIDLTKVEFG